MRLDDFTVPGDNLTVRGGLRIESESLAGNTSGTDRTSKGIKPKTFSVALLIKFKDESKLTELIRAAEAVDSNGRLKIYSVVDRTINVASVRQVQFDDNFSWREDEEVHAWQVSFSLVEYKSVPEKTEQRQTKKTATPSASVTGGTTTTPAETTTEPQAAAMTGFEAFLARVDKALE